MSYIVIGSQDVMHLPVWEIQFHQNVTEVTGKFLVESMESKWGGSKSNTNIDEL